VIRELEIRDLVVIERAHIEPARGLTAVTGETGAGKTVLAQALALLAGGPADPRMVRPGARHALVQAALAVPEGFWDRLEEDDPAHAVREAAEDPAEVVVARRLPAEGRARALVDGQAVAREAVAAFVGALVRSSGQHEQRRLVGPAAQLGVLDAFAGPDAVALAERLAGLRRRARRAERALAAARARAERARAEREDLAALVEEVDRVGPDPEEEAALRAERARLVHAERLAQAAAQAAGALGGDDAPGALGLAGQAARVLEAVTEVDPALAAPHAELRSAEATLQEALLTLRGYLEALEAEPGRLAQVEERLDAYRRLQRRHGGDTAAVLARAAEAREALGALEEGAGEAGRLAAEHAAALGEAREAAAALHDLRAAAAPRLEAAVVSELGGLAMGAATVRVEIAEEGGDPPADRVTLWLRANPGLPEAPLAATASGGELSRVLLALHGVAAAAEPGIAWVFDEVDAGIGGVTAAAVGAKLAALAAGRQVVVITHLPQVAASADRHYRLVKGLAGDGRAVTTIEPVQGEDLVAELCRMLGAAPGDPGARRHAEELLARRGR
jgi:DNA repair protein RecN (Recombination protein N)